MDIKLVSTLYDIKSGPNVLNLRDVDGVNKKIDLISKLQNKSFGKFIEVTNYKVAIIYGNWELRNSYMKKIDIYFYITLKHFLLSNFYLLPIQ